MNMNDILVPIGGPDESRRAADQAIALYRREPARIHLLNVQRPLPRHIAQFFSGGDLRDFHRDAGMRVLGQAMQLLDEAGVPHQDHVLVGNQAETIVRFAQHHHCSEVILDNPSKGLFSMFGLGSIGSQVRHLMQSQTPAATTPEISGSA